MTDKALFCIGYGYTAAVFANRLRQDAWTIAGTTTKSEKAETMLANGVQAHIWDGDAFDPAWLDGQNAILVSTPPNDDGCPALRATQGAIADRRDGVTWLGYLSTNGVYGDHQGAWVDETSPLTATSERGRRRVAAEHAWRAFAAKHDLPLIIFRLPGIYGPGRSAIDTVRAGKAKRIFKEGQVFSRMHVDDIAAALDASINKPRVYDLYNLADDEPAPPQDVIEYACTLLDVAPPALVNLEQAALSDMAKSFYADNKRVSNQRMKDALEVSLSYPTYREGLRAIFNNESRAV